MRSNRARLRTLGLTMLFGICSAACYGPPATPAPKVPLELESIPIGTRIQFSVMGRRTTGTLSAVSPDSLSLRSEGVVTTLARTAVDTVWVRAPGAHSRTAIGLGFGLVAGGILLATGTGEGENGYLAGLAILVGLGLGVAADLVEPAPWIVMPLR